MTIKSSAVSQVRTSITYREFQLPPVGEGVIVGRHASIGPTALYESLERMLPKIYELVRVDDHPSVEGIIVMRSQLNMLGKERLVELLLDHAGRFHSPSMLLQVTIRSEVTVHTESEVT